MKKVLLSALFSIFLLSSALQAKTLVVFYSLSWNTFNAARIIQEETGSDMFGIELVDPYPTEYKNQLERAKKELDEGIFPSIVALPPNMNEYDVIFVGSPVWMGTISTPIRTFLKKKILKGKTIIPFVTHGSGGPGKSFEDVAALCEGCKVITDGWSGYGNWTLGLRKWAKDKLEEAIK